MTGNGVKCEEEIFSGGKHFSFDVASALYNVVIISETPCGGEKRRHSQIANHTPIEWPRAVQWVQGIMTGIGRDWDYSKFIDIYIEPVSCPRPWTPEILAAYQRELRRYALEIPTQRQIRDAAQVEELRQKVADTHAAMGWGGAA